MTASPAQKPATAPQAAPSFGIRSIRIDSRALCFDGAGLGAVGRYEKLEGSILAEFDPAHPLTAGIVNLGKAPRNASGGAGYL